MGLLVVGSISEVGTCSEVNQGERKCLHHRTTVGRFEVSEMNGKGRLIVSKIGEYSHLTMPSQIFDSTRKPQRNHLEISVHKQKKKKNSLALPFTSLSLPPFLFFDNTSSLSSRPLRHRTPFQPGCRPRFSSQPGHAQVVGDVKIGVFPCVFIPLRHGPFADLTAFHSGFRGCYFAAVRAPVIRVSFDGSIIVTPPPPTFK